MNTITIVQKYGGSSVATTKQIADIAQHIKKLHDNGTAVVVVASAMGKTTNGLISLAEELATAPNTRDMDFLLSTGEMQTVSLMSICLNDLGVPSVALTGFQAGIITNNNYSRAFITKMEIDRIKAFLKAGKVVVVAGFQGITELGDITTLGRGGSDTSAVAIAAALGCLCEIYTDVHAVHTVDPRLFANSKSLHKISYDEMMEMAVNGAKVLEPRSVELAKKNNVPLYLGKTLSKEKNGTTISSDYDFETMPIKSMCIKDNVSVLNIEMKKNHFVDLSKIFYVIHKCNINLEMISQVILDKTIIFSFSLPTGKEDETIACIKENVNLDDKQLSIVSNLSKITLVGIGFATHTEIPKNLFAVLAKNKILVGHISVSEISISFTIRTEDKQSTINAIATEFSL